MQRGDLWVWLDLEMTGLEPRWDRVIEMACIITDQNLEQVGEDFSLVIHQSDEVLDKMDEWNTKQHGSTGLIAEVQASPISETEAQYRFLEFLKTYLKPKTAPLCGNSIGQDRRFLYRYFPRIANYVHYRSIDVTSFKLVADSCYPGMKKYKRSNVNHRALDDIRGSIDELRHYKTHWLTRDADDA